MAKTANAIKEKKYSFKATKLQISMNFNEILLEVVDEALSSLGEAAKNEIYNLLEKTFKITKDQIPQRVQDFSYSMEQIFGVGARYLEALLMKKLHARIGKNLRLTLSTQNFTFPLYVDSLLRALEDDSENMCSIDICMDNFEEYIIPPATKTRGVEKFR